MNRKILLIRRIAIFLLTGIICTLIIKTASTFINQSRSEKVLSSLSGIMGFLGNKVELEELPPCTLLVYFNSECYHCREEIADLKLYVKKLRDIRIIFVSHEPREQGIRFLHTYQLLEYSNIEYPDIDPENIMEVFSGRMPQLLLYENDRLKKHFKGSTSIPTVINLIEQ